MVNDQPTLLMRYADAGDLYLSWRWTHDLDNCGVGRFDAADVDATIAALTAALPTSTGVLSALSDGAMSDYDTELALSRRLTRNLLLPELARQLDELWEDGVRPRLRIQPSPRLAQVPWELLAADPEDVRLIELADISLLAPASVVHAPNRPTRSFDPQAPIVAILDPKVPGFRADSRLGSVLGRVAADAALAQRVGEYVRTERLRLSLDAETGAFRRTDTDRDWLAGQLATRPSRLLYVGHATAADPETGEGEHARLHLSCTATTTGLADPIRGHRPFSAKDLLLDGGPTRYPIPARAALIACESGGDLRFAETLGLATAMIHNGAQLVTATRWSLATDYAIQRVGGDGEPVDRPLREAVLAIDTAHETTDPVGELGQWQRERLRAWRDKGHIADSPLLWGAFITIDTAASVIAD